MIVTDKEELFRLCQAYRVHGSGENGLLAYGKEKKVPVDLEHLDFGGNLPKYFNFVVGRNSRLDALQASLLRVKLPHLDEWNAKRRDIASYYHNNITNPKAKKPVCSAEGTHIYYVYVIEVEDRENFRAYMKEQGIATGVYFPVPLHLQKVFQGLGYQAGDMPNAEYLAEHGTAIPLFPELEDNEVRKVADAVNAWEG